MKFRKISIDGYGRLAARTIKFSPGLQVIIGPNEKGKSTIRCFVSDMLYGQKKSSGQQQEEAHDLRLPWYNPDCYGGKLLYEMDNGTQIEVFRNFDRNRESIQVFDRTQNHEITHEFDRLRNRELNFAATHLGLTKDMFLSTATISHFSLENLGDTDALNQIRDKILSLTDSGDESNSADAALRRLRERIETIGRPGSRSKPYPSAKVRLEQLEREYVQAMELHRALQDVSEQRRKILQEAAGLQERRLSLEADMKLLDSHERAARLREADALAARVATATQHCFALGAVREFPLDRIPDVQRAENLVATARLQVERTRTERKALLQQFENEKRQIGAEGPRSLQDIPDEMETRLNELTSSIQHLDQRISETESFVATAALRLEEAQISSGNLPDFSRIASDPVEWISQLASSFSVAMRARDEEQALYEKLRDEVTRRRDSLAPTHQLFLDVQDFPDRAREYQLGKRNHEDHLMQQANALHTLQLTRDEIAEKTPGFMTLAGVCIAFLVALIAAYLYTRKPAIIMAIVTIVLAILYFLMNIAVTRRRLRQITAQIEESSTQLNFLRNPHLQSPGIIENLMENAGCQTLRELEALYDQFRAASAELAARTEVLKVQEAKAQEANERIPQLLARFRKTFEDVGEQIDSEDDIRPAAGRAIARYQDYREAKRRLTDSRGVLEKHQGEVKRLVEMRAKYQAQLDAVTEHLRRTMRDNGFRGEDQHEAPIAAIRAYRNRLARHREHRGRFELLQEKGQNIDRQIKREDLELEKHNQELGKLLAQAGVTTMEQWHTMAEQAREYREIWNKRSALEEQLETLLRGEDIRTLRQAVEQDGEPGPAPQLQREQIKMEIQTISHRLEERRKEEHGLHITMTQRSAGIRSLNEIEEERSAIDQQVRRLEQELQATSYAMAQIEEIARDKHARIAPQLAGLAGGYLAEITNGNYSELGLSRDLNISVRIPQTEQMNESPEKTLSKGTVDQVYLALRLALIQGISACGESIPMLLDDPFANYDDTRLERTLKLMAKIGEKNQVILFTCREDVARAAEAIEAPVLRL